MNLYENIVILDASLPDEATQAAIEKIKDLIASSEGEILKVETWGRKKLAYEINRHNKGFYVFLLFKSPSFVIKRLEEFYKVFDPVIKFMVIKLEKKQAAAALASLPGKDVPPAEGQ